MNDPILLSLENKKGVITNRINSRNQQIDEKRQVWNKAEKDKNDEWNLGKFSGKTGKGGYYRDLKKAAADAENDYLTTRARLDEQNVSDNALINDLDNEINKRRKSVLSEIDIRSEVQAQSDGLIARLTALNNLMYNEVTVYQYVEGERIPVGVKREKSAIWYAKWLITLLFISIEIAPILFKLMTRRGSYDDIIDRIKHEEKVKQLLLQSNINEEVNTAVKIHTDKNKQKLNAELIANKGVLESIANAQAEIAEVAIEEWKKEQMEKIKNNPSSMIRS